MLRKSQWAVVVMLSMTSFAAANQDPPANPAPAEPAAELPAAELPADGPDAVAPAVEAPAPGCIEKTVMVKVWCTENRLVKETCYRKQVVDKPYTVMRKIKVNKEVPYKYTVWVQEERVDEQKIKIKTPTYKWVDQKYVSEYAPAKDTVTKCRKTRECVTVPMSRKVCEDQGHYEQREVCCQDECGNTIKRMEQVWIPNVVEKYIECDVKKWVDGVEHYPCEVDICVPIEKTRKVKEWDTKVEEKTIKHKYMTAVPKERTKMVMACVTEEVPETCYKKCVISVPYTVERIVKVRVCKTVPKTILVPAPCQQCHQNPCCCK